jgi:uncharacterized membrane protein
MGREVKHLPLYRAEFKSEWSCTSTPPLCMHGADGKNFTFLERGLSVQQRCAGYKTNFISGLIIYLLHGAESFLRSYQVLS